MWSFISNLAIYSTTAGGAAAVASPSAAAAAATVGGGTSSPKHLVGRTTSPHQVSQPAIVSLSAATLKQVNALSSAPIPRTNSRSRMPSDLLSDSGVSDCDMLSDFDFDLVDSNFSDWVEIRKATEMCATEGPSSLNKSKPLYSAVAKASALAQQQKRGPIVSTPSVASRNARKRHKQARNRKYKNHLRDLEISQARRLGHTNA